MGELLTVDETMADLILNRSRTAVLQNAAVAAGMTTLENAGVACAAAGVTTLTELRRVLPPGIV
jgi:type II secretory ATPase GspE/PulE/Tfp pilus assembly ATPase PilB-like protein